MKEIKGITREFELAFHVRYTWKRLDVYASILPIQLAGYQVMTWMFFGTYCKRCLEWELNFWEIFKKIVSLMIIY